MPSLPMTPHPNLTLTSYPTVTMAESLCDTSSFRLCVTDKQVYKTNPHLLDTSKLLFPVLLAHLDDSAACAHTGHTGVTGLRQVVSLLPWREDVRGGGHLLAGADGGFDWPDGGD